MGRAKKKSLSQKVVGLSTSGMPAPVQRFLSNRLISGLVLLLAPILLGFGIVSMDWENGFPRFSINREKAKEVTEKAAAKLHEIREERDADTSSPPIFTSLINKPSETVADQTNQSGLSLFGEKTDAQAVVTSQAEGDKKSLFGNGPLSGLKQRLEKRF